MALPQLQIDERCDRIEAALGALADSAGEGELVRAILYRSRTERVKSPHEDGGGEPRGEGDSTTPEELHIAHDIAKTHHAFYIELAHQYGHTPSSPTSWEDMPETQKNLLVAIITKMLDSGVIKANRD